MASDKQIPFRTKLGTILMALVVVIVAWSLYEPNMTGILCGGCC